MPYIRRAFEKALDEHKSLAEFVLREIQNLYRIEQMADEKEMSHEQQKSLHKKLATPILDFLEQWMKETYPTMPRINYSKTLKTVGMISAGMKNYIFFRS